MHVRIIFAVCLLFGVNAAAAQERSVEESVGDWQVLCFDDEVAQYRSCYVIRGDLSVLVSSRDYELVFVGDGAKRSPGSEVSAQVDGKETLNWREDDFYADEVFASAIRQFRAGQKVKLTWTNKDPGEEVTSEVSLLGFTKAYRRANALISEYQAAE
jgi:hypothetical protein